MGADSHICFFCSAGNGQRLKIESFGAIIYRIVDYNLRGFHGGAQKTEKKEYK